VVTHDVVRELLVDQAAAGRAGLRPGQRGARPAASSFIWEPGSPLDGLPGAKFSPAKNALALNFALRAITAQPGGYVTAVLHDFCLAFTWDIPPHPSALMIRRYEFGYATTPWISPGAVVVPGHTVASDRRAYGGQDTTTRAVEPFAGWLRGYQRFGYLRGSLLVVVLLVGLAGIARAWRGGGTAHERGGPGLLPWLASLTLLLVPVMTADYSERYTLIAVPAARHAAGLAFARPGPAPSPGPVTETARTAAPAGP
jgi:hypothetical protein